MPNVTILRGDTFVTREDRAGVATIKVGMLVDFDASGRLRPHANSGAYAARMFALEPDYIGKDTTYTYNSGDKVLYADCAPGIILYAHLASGQNVTRGATLQSNGAGFLTAVTGTGVAVAQADEDANASTGISAGGSLRFRARVI